ncbi:MAG: hypothetical protein AB1489_27870 [Acidobacteriota bacterium]
MADPEITVDSLIVYRKDLDRELAKLDSLNPADRQIVVAAIEKLVTDFMLNLNDIPLTEGDLVVYPPETIIFGMGDDFIGNMMDLFANRMPGLAQKPSDEELTALIEQHITKTTDPAQRDRFYRCWAASQADTTILGLLQFLKYKLPGPPYTAPQPLKVSIKSERQRLQKLLKHRLPLRIRNEFKNAVDFLGRYMSAAKASS